MLTAGFLLTAILQLDIKNLLYCVGSLLGIIFTPDLDVDNGFIGNAIVRKYGGKFTEKVWDIIWHWYRRSLKHGSPLSHFPYISTYGRIVYLFVLFIVIPHSGFYYIFQPAWELEFVLNWYWQEITSQQEIIRGLIASDTIHFFLDIMTTEHKASKTKGL